MNNVDPKYPLTALAMICGTTIISMMFYAMSVPTIPGPPAPPPTLAEEILKCSQDSYTHISGNMRVDEQKDILKACTDAVIAANNSPNIFLAPATPAPLKPIPDVFPHLPQNSISPNALALPYTTIPDSGITASPNSTK